MLSIAIDIGGTNIAAGLVDESCNIVFNFSRPTIIDKGAQGILAQVIAGINELEHEAKRRGCMPSGVGIAVPGWVDENGYVLITPNLPLSDTPFLDMLEKEISLPITLENDANCALIGELAAGVAQNVSDCVLLTVGTGLGSAVYENGSMLNPRGGGELGHMLLVRGGQPCGCGRRGCAESYCSANALIRMAREQAVRLPGSILCENGHIDAKSVFDASKKGDEAARSALDIYFGFFADMLMNIVVMFRPQKIIIGGGVANAGRAFFEPVRKRLYDPTLMGTYCRGDMPQLVAARLINAGIVGAGAIAMKSKLEGENFSG